MKVAEFRMRRQLAAAVVLHIVACLIFLVLEMYVPMTLLIALGLMYLPIVALVGKARSPLVKYFVYIFATINVVSPVFFFLNRDRYSYSGWSAVKDFDFSVLGYLGISSYIAAFLLSVTVLSILGQTYLPRDLRRSLTRPPEEFVGGRSQPAKRVGSRKYDILYFGLVLLFIALNNWMFTLGIALTGLTGGQEALPFKLAGILYFFTRFGVPVVLFLVLRKSTRSLLVIFVAVVYASLAGLSQVSRTTFTTNFAPVLYLVLMDKRYIRFLVLSALFFFFYSTIENARFLVYSVVNNVAVKGFEGDLFQLVGSTLALSESIDWAPIIVGVLDRVGGAQDVVLGFQFDTSGTGGSFYNFLRAYFALNLTPDVNLQEALYGFTPPFGFAVGEGGTCSQILQVAGGNYIVVVLVGLFFSVILLTGEVIRLRIARLFDDGLVALVFVALFLVLLVAIMNYLWFYTFVFVSFIALTVAERSMKVRTLPRVSR